MDTSYSFDRSSVSEATRCFVVNAQTTTDARNLYASVEVQPQTLGYVQLLGKTGEFLVLEVRVDEQSNIIISDNEFYVYGVGKTEDEALRDYRVSFVEYFELVSGDPGQKSVQLANRLSLFLPDNQ